MIKMDINSVNKYRSAPSFLEAHHIIRLVVQDFGQSFVLFFLVERKKERTSLKNSLFNMSASSETVFKKLEYISELFNDTFYFHSLIYIPPFPNTYRNDPRINTGPFTVLPCSSTNLIFSFGVIVLFLIRKRLIVYISI